MKIYQRFVRGFLVASLGAMGVLLAFNYRMDPNGRYTFDISPRDLARLAMSPGQVLVVRSNFDDRLLLKKFISVAPTPSVAMIGGSRIMNFQPSERSMAFRDGFLNAGVSAGTLRDYIAIWQIMKETGRVPKMIFLCVDPQALDRTAQNDRWLSIAEHYQAFFKKGASGRYYVASLTSQLKDLLSLQTTLASITQIGKGRIQPRLLAQENYNGRDPVRLSTFSELYPLSYENQPVAKVRTLARQNGEGEVKSFKNWNRADPESFDHLRALLLDMRGHGVRVALVLMPYHPLSLGAVEQDPAARESLAFFRNQLVGVSGELNIFYYDGFQETEDALFKDEDFSDGVHLKAVPIRDFFSRACRKLGLDIF